MTLRRSRLLETLRSGKSATMFKLNLTDPGLVEVAAVAGASTLWLCNEHVPSDWSNLCHRIRAAKLHNVDTLVRVSKGSYSDYIKPFEADATGIMVPHVSSEEEARAIVQMVRFQPLGKRALDGGNADGRYGRAPLPEYLAHSNTERFVVLQIESPEALEAIDAIAAVPGFDILLFGAGDFSHQIGKPGQMDAREVVAARQRIGQVARANGKWAALAGLPAPRVQLEAEGYSLFSIGVDVIGWHDYVRDSLQKFEAANK